VQCPMPTININEQKELKNILQECKKIAIVGLSPNPEKDSHKVGKYLKEAGYKIYPIYPKEESILGEKVYRSLSEIKDEIDTVNMFRKPSIADELVKEIALRDDVKCLWLQLGIVNNEAAKKAQDLGIKVVQNRCIKIEHERQREKDDSFK